MPIWMFLGFAGIVELFQTPLFPEASWNKTTHESAEMWLYGYRDSIPHTNRVLAVERFSFDSTLKEGKDWRIRFKPLLQADPLNDSATERYWAELPEGYLQYQSNGWKTQLGYNTFNWGVTDVYNPLDVLNARRYQDPLRQEKLGAPSISLKKDIDNVSLEAVWIPRQRKSILPGEQSRWLPRQVFTTTSLGSGDQTAILNLPPELEYHYSPDTERDTALSNNFGFRTQVSGVTQGLDLGLQYFEGAAVTPAIDLVASGNVVSLQPQLVIDADPRISLVPVYYRQRVYGGTLVWALGGMIFRGEASFTRLISHGNDLLGNAEEYVVAAERPFPLGGHDLTLILQGTHAQHSIPMTNTATALNRIFDRSAILALRYPFSEQMTVLISALWDMQFHEEFGHIEASYSLTDTWKLGMSADALWGAPQTPLGSYNNNDRAMLTLKADF